MNFLYPWFLYSLFLVAIPIIIHFFNFRKYKLVYFSSLKFLTNISKETRSRNKLKHLLVLLSRILFIVCLVLAFSQPYIPSKNKKKLSNSQIVSVYIDNSFSMSETGTNGSLFEEAKNNAIDIVSSYPASTQFYIITNDFEPRHQHLLNREQIIDYITSVKISPRNIYFSDIINRTKQFLKNNNILQVNVFLLSDLQKYWFDFEKLINDSNINISIINEVANSTKNISIDTVWFDYPEHNLNQNEKLNVKITNHSNESYQSIPIKLFINNTVKSLSSFSVQPNSSEVVTISYTNITKGNVNCKLEITDYPVTFDNTYYFNYFIKQYINVLCINGINSSKYLTKLFNNDTLFKFNELPYKNINYELFNNAELIVLNELPDISSGLQQEVLNYINNGGSVVFIPEYNNMQSYKQFLLSTGINLNNIDSSKNQMGSVNYKSDFFKNVFDKVDDNPKLPTINFSMETNMAKTYLYSRIIESKNKNPLLLEVKINNGRFFPFLFPLNEKYSDFAVHPLFVPILYRICELSGKYNEICYNIEPNVVVNIPNVEINLDKAIELENTSSKISFIPQQTINNSDILLMPGSQLINDGFYNVKLDQNVFNNVSFNYTRKESENTYYSDKEITQKLNSKNYNVTTYNTANSSVKSIISQNEIGTPLWKLFILLSILFVTAEILLIKLLK